MLCGATYQWQVGNGSWAGEPRRGEPPHESPRKAQRGSQSDPQRGPQSEPQDEQKVGLVVAAPEPWREIDRKLRRIAKRRGALDHEELELIRQAIVHSIWREHGMTSIREYLEDAMGYGPTVASERVRVAEALDAMPLLATALASHELHYSAIREITRIATRKTEGAWVDACRGKNLREIEDLLAEREPGDRPESPRKPDLRMRDLRFKVRPATEANVRLARQLLEAEVGERLDGDELLDALAQRVLSGGGARDRAAYQVAVTFCPHCRVARQTAAGAEIALRPEELECALCDAEWLNVRGQERARQDVTPAVRKVVRLRDHGRCRVPGCRAARNIDVHHIIPRWQGGSHDPDNLLLLCSGHHKALHRGALRIDGPASTAVITKLHGAEFEVDDEVADFHVESRAAAIHVESDAANFHVESDAPDFHARNEAVDFHVEDEAADRHVNNDASDFRVKRAALDFHVESVARSHDERASAESYAERASDEADEADEEACTDPGVERLRAEASVRADALLTLRTLGFTRAESARAVEAALDESEAPLVLEALVRASLRHCPKPT